MSGERCPACNGEGVTGERRWEQVTLEGGVWWNVVCSVCDGTYNPAPVVAAGGVTEPAEQETK